jgi:flagellar protein FlbD
MILSVEGTPDTMITLSNDSKVIVKDKIEDVIERIITYQRLVRNPELALHIGE